MEESPIYRVWYIRIAGLNLVGSVTVTISMHLDITHKSLLSIYEARSFSFLKNYKWYRYGNPESFSCMLAKKTFKELSTPTSNGIAVSVRYVSSKPVALDDKENN